MNYIGYSMNSPHSILKAVSPIFLIVKSTPSDVIGNVHCSTLGLSLSFRPRVCTSSSLPLANLVAALLLAAAGSSLRNISYTSLKIFYMKRADSAS